jgi:hypothetical protein
MNDVGFENALRIIRDASIMDSERVQLTFSPHDLVMLSNLARALDGLGFRAELTQTAGVLWAVRKHSADAYGNAFA